MRLFYSNECAQHAPEFEILSGNAVPYLESPDRMAKIMSHLAQDDRTSSWQWTDIDSSDLQPDETNHSNSPLDAFEAISKVHSPDYVDYLKHAYELWVQDGGSKASIALIAEYIISESHLALRNPGSRPPRGIPTSFVACNSKLKDYTIKKSFAVSQSW